MNVRQGVIQIYCTLCCTSITENALNWDSDSWSQYQQDCQDQTTRGQTCDLVEIVSDSRLINLAEMHVRLGNEKCGLGRRTLFKDVKGWENRNFSKI